MTSAELGPARWEDTDSGQDLVEQWRIEQHGAPLGGRPARRFVLTVRTDDGADVLGEVPWAAIAAVCPTARDEDRRTDAGESVMPVADAFPWSGGAHITDEADDLDTRAAPEHAG